MKIAMWSGPRNLSTAMMYAFGNRSDCDAVDEPFYASYLARTGIMHPMQDAILSSQPNDPADVITALTASSEAPIQYQKHMTHHMDGVPLHWLDGMENVFLIRHPARVIASYAQKRENPNLHDLGFVQQVAIYDYCQALGQKPIVVDSDDMLSDPPTMMRQLCSDLQIPYQDAMVSWAAGPREYDGVWASHWYDAAHLSTGLTRVTRKLPSVDSEFEDLLTQAMPLYNQMSALKITENG